MSYTAIPSVVTGQTYAASAYNTYLKGNIEALWPYTASGDLALATSPTALARLPVGATGKVLTVVAGAPAWADPAAAITLANVYPVGCIYTSTIATNPATIFGFGTWAAFGAGRVLVGDGTSDAAFAAGATGGESTHLLSSAEMPAHGHAQTAHTHVQDAHTHTQNAHNHTQDAHNHFQNAHNHTQDAHSHQIDGYQNMREAGSGTQNPVYQSGSASVSSGSTTATNQATTASNQTATATNQAATATNQSTTATDQATTAVNQNTGGGGTHNNLQPYIVVYFFKRTA